MRTVVVAQLTVLIFVSGIAALGQTSVIPQVNQANHHDVSPPLRSIPPGTPPPPVAHAPLPNPRGPKNLGPTLADPVIQSTFGPRLSMPSTFLNFDGIGYGVSGYVVYEAPTDSNLTVGPNHIVDLVNTALAVYDKSGNLLYGPVSTNTLWKGFGGNCESDNDGDGTVRYDPIADRFIFSQFAITNPNPNFLQCIAVSQTPDPTGAYNRYSFSTGSTLNDYGKIAVWPSGYFLTFNGFNAAGTAFLGAQVCALDRANMLLGNAASQICFTVSGGYDTLLPSDFTGVAKPPSGAPNHLLTLGATNQLAMWNFAPNWGNPSAANQLTGPIAISVAAYLLPCNNTGGVCVPQSETTQLLDTVGDRLMYRNVFRKFPDHEALVVSHSVAANSAVGMRWYEIRLDSSSNPSLYQQGTYAPDSTYRWMGAAAIDQSSNIGLGYSASSSSIHPQIRYTGRLASDPLNSLPQGEATIFAGSGSQTGNGLDRWGDYSGMDVDPADGCSFWYTNQYIPSNGAFNWRTRIASFRFPTCITFAPVTPVLAAVVNTSYPALTVVLKDSNGNPLSGAAVTFQSGGLTATVSFPSGNTAITNASGIASVAAQANGLVGTFPVYATTPSAGNTAYFTLTNIGTNSTLTASSGTPQTTSPGTAFAQPLQVLVKDSNGKAVQGIAVTFASPVSGASASLSSTTVLTNASGIAGVNAQANSIAGSYNVTATVAGLSSTATFALTNSGPQAPPTGTAYITGQAPGAVRNNFSGFVGMRFTVGASAVSVSSLGRLYLSGNSGTHIVKLVQANGIDLPGGSVTLTMASGTPNAYQYASLTPVTLQANTSYYLVSQEANGGDTWYDIGTVNTTSIASVDGPVYFAGGSYFLVALSPTNYSYVPANLLYSSGGGTVNAPPTVSITAPPPNTTVSGKSVLISATASAATGLTISAVQFKVDGAVVGASNTSPYQVTFDSTTVADGSHTLSATATDSAGNSTTASVSVTVSNGSAPPPAGAAFIATPNPGPPRNNYTGYVGMQFTAGAAPVSVNALGRVYVSGNSGTHIVKLVNSNGIDVPGGAVSVNVAGGTVNQFTYASLPATVTLNANTTYFLVSQETSGGDVWYDFSAQSATSVASITGPIYSTGPTNYYLVTGFPNYSFVPVSFKYGGSAAAPPTVLITQPATNSSASGTITISATASAASGLSIASVQFKVDGNNIGTATSSSPYQVQLDTTTLSNGSHVLTAVATDSSGVSSTSAAVTITVNNAVAPPTVSIGTPGNGASVSGLITITASASAASGRSITSVQFKVDGNNIGTAASSSPYQVQLDTTTLSNGSHVLTAVATDSGGASSTSAPITITVNNSAAPPPSGSPFLTNQSFGPARNNYSGFVGMQIAVSGSALSVTSLGRMCLSGNAGTHIVKLVSTNGVDVPGGSVSIAMPGCSAGQYRYAPLASPVQLSAGGSFYLVSQETSGGDQWYDYGPVTTGAGGSVAGPIYSTGPSTYYLVTVPGYSYVPVNLLYGGTAVAPPQVAITQPANGATVSNTIAFAATASAAAGLTIAKVQFRVDGSNVSAAVTTSPYSISLDTTQFANGGHSLTAVATDSNGVSTTSAMVTVTVNNAASPPPSGSPFITGQNPGPVRNNFDGWVGMEFGFGSSTKTVTSLGRICLAGNVGTHTVKLVSAGGVDLAGGSASISMNGCTPGQYVYAPLTSPFTLLANTNYIVASQEFNGGDQWYDYGPVTTSTGSVIAPVYQTGQQTYVSVPASGYAYVPVNLLIQ